MSIDTIYEEHFKMVYRYLISLTNGDDELAEELTQETFYQAVKSYHRFNGECKVSTWLCQIAKHAWFRYLEKKKIRQEVSIEEVTDYNISQKGIEQTFIENQMLNDLYAEIEKLDENTKEVMLHRIKGNLSFREIGDALGKSENWARVTFFRGKQKVGKELSQYE